jgi:hypothetical protein
MPPSESGEDLNLRADLNVIGAHDATFGRNVTIRGSAQVAAGRSTRRLGELEGLAHHPGVARWRQNLALSRSGGAGALSAIILVIGDSRVRAASTLFRNAWPDRLLRRFLGATPGGYGLLPASGSLAQVTDGGWPSGDNPWTFTGGVTGNIGYGLGFHGANIPTAGSATFTYFGDKATLFYVRTVDGPTAATISIDGVALATLNARGTLLPGQQVQRGTHGDYGFHTLTITPNDGPLILEGAQWFDADAPFFVSGSVQLFDGSHSGFQAAQWAGANNDWSAMLTGADAFFGMGLLVHDVNDIALGLRTPAQFRDDIVTIVQRVDARLGTQTLSWLFGDLPTTINANGYTNTLPFVQAMRDAAEIVGTDRAAALDMGALRPERKWGAVLSGDGSHPNDSGNIWLADTLGQVLDPTPATTAPISPKRLVIDATTPTEGRLAWTFAPAAIAGTTHVYDEATASALRERRHRVWLDAGIPYQPILSAEHATGRGILEVLIGRWVSNTPTLTSCGTVDTSTPAGPAITTTTNLTTVTSDITGWHPLVIRKTNQANIARFVQLVLNKQG